VTYWFSGWRLVLWFLVAFILVTLLFTYTLQPD
jgi:hypothetical protein